MTETMKIEWDTSSGSAPVLRLIGRLDAAGAKQLHEAAMASLKNEKEKNLVVDLAGVEFVASTGLATFLLLTEEYTEVQGAIVFVNATQAVLQVINLLNIEQFLKLEDSLESAFGLVGSQ